MDDIEIIDSVLSGDSEKFGILVEKYSAKIYRICRSLCANVSDAEDATQEAFIDAFRYLGTLSDRSKFCPWLVSIARRKALKLIKGREHYTDIDEIAEFLSSDYNFTDDLALRDDRRGRISRAICKLSDKRRTVCEMHYFRGMKICDIAKALSISESTVKSRLYDTREYLRKELYDMDENKVNIKELEEKIKKQIKELDLYYSLNGGKFDENFNSKVEETKKLVDKISKNEQKQYYLSSVLMYQSFAEADSDKKQSIIEESKKAAESGKNARIIADGIIDDYFKIYAYDESNALKFLEETGTSKISEFEGTEDYGYAKGVISFWHGRTLFRLNRLDEARSDFETAISLFNDTDSYKANAIAAVHAIDSMREKAYDPTMGVQVTAEGLIYDNGKLFFHNQPGFMEDFTTLSAATFDYNTFFYFASCGRVIFDINMKPGDKITDDNLNTSLECISYDETVSVAAGSFENCMHMRTEGNHWSHGRYTLDMYYATGVGLVKASASFGDGCENYELLEFHIDGGDGYMPFALGNRWLYRCPDAPNYIYHDIEKTVAYTDGYITNLAVTSPVTACKDFNECDDVDSSVYLAFADKLCDEWKISEALEMLRNAVRLNKNEEAVRISLYGIEVLNRFEDYQKKGYRFCPSSINSAYISANENGVSYKNPYVSRFGPYRFGSRGRYEDRIFGIKPFVYLDRFMDRLWDKKWIPGYREEKDVKNGLKLIFTVEDGGTVSVPAGEFDNCRKVTIRVDKPEDADEWWYFKDGYSNMDGGLKEYWFAPGVGIVKIASTWGSLCYAECLLKEYNTPAAKETEYFPVQIGNYWEYDEPHLTDEGYRAKAIFRIPSGMNGKFLMTSSQEFICFKTEEEYNEFSKESHSW